MALRLYVSRYFCQRPLRSQEFIYRVKMALRSKELRLMQGARDQTDTYSFAFECLLGHLALNKPYRLHQIVSEFGWVALYDIRLQCRVRLHSCVCHKSPSCLGQRFFQKCSAICIVCLGSNRCH